MSLRMVNCSCCGYRAFYVERHVGIGCTLWAVECGQRCFITDFFYSKGEARKQWNNKDIQKSLAAQGKWERRNKC